MSVDFALIGHLEDWSAAAAVVGALRGNDLPPLPDEELRSIVPWLPPRTVCRVVVRSKTGRTANGIYVDLFIPPDHLDSRFLRENLARVLEAAEYVTKEGARVATLGGFSSILLEGRVDRLHAFTHVALEGRVDRLHAFTHVALEGRVDRLHAFTHVALEGRVDRLPAGTRFTTGNTLTVALIVRGIERACALSGLDLANARLLIIGATGDVGSGCARVFAPRVRKLVLCARNQARLLALRDELGTDVVTGVDAEELAREADLVLCAASLASPELLLAALPRRAVVCDAGYPKNVLRLATTNGPIVFFGGLGRVSEGMTMAPDLEGVLNRHPYSNVAHGCLLEGMALALEQRFESFSAGRGGITPQRVAEMGAIAERHGLELAPLHDARGSVEETLKERLPS